MIELTMGPADSALIGRKESMVVSEERDGICALCRERRDVVQIRSNPPSEEIQICGECLRQSIGYHRSVRRKGRSSW